MTSFNEKKLLSEKANVLTEEISKKSLDQLTSVAITVVTFAEGISLAVNYINELEIKVSDLQAQLKEFKEVNNE